MNIKAFFVDALSSALELRIGTPDDVLRHVTPDVLAQHLPRPLWARLLTACLGAPRVDAQLVVETVGVPNLCEHVPTSIIWACIAELGARSLGRPVEARAPTPVPSSSSQPVKSVLAPPPEIVKPTATPARGTPVSIGPSIPKPTPARGMPAQPDPEAAAAPTPVDEKPATTSSLRSRTPTGQRFRQSGSSARTLGGVSRRPQAAAVPSIKPAKRSEPTDYETETAVEAADWREKEIVVDDEQLVDWQADPGSAVSTAITGDDDFSDLGSRKR